MNVITMGSSFPVCFFIFPVSKKSLKTPCVSLKTPCVYPPSLIEITEQNNPTPFLYEILKRNNQLYMHVRSSDHWLSPTAQVNKT